MSSVRASNNIIYLYTYTLFTDNDIQVKSRVSMGTSPMSTPPHGNKVTMATSPNLSEHSDESDDGRKLVDVATSISYR